MSFASLESRLKDLEHSGGYLTLPDGSRFNLSNAILMFVDYAKLRHDLSRVPMLSDFTPSYREQWRCFALWEPDAEAYGGIAVAVAKIARKLVARNEAAQRF